MQRWNPPVEPSKREQLILKRLKRTRKLFAFLRRHRHELFDDAFQTELEGMYRATGAGSEPVPPAKMCIALILQGYMRVSDAEAVELTVVDLRWQMVLDHLGADEPAFSQGALQKFRRRLIDNDMDVRLLERTIELARSTREFDWKKLPKDLRVAVDSRPLIGAGRVEDTVNLLGHAARKLVRCAAKILGRKPQAVSREAGIPLLLHASVKAGLDIDWNDPLQKDAALEELVAQVACLDAWLEKERLAMEEPLKPYIAAIAQVREQNLDEAAEASPKMRQGVAKDRRVSISDPEMKHGRKSKTKRFNGYKEHIAADLDTGLILACATTPANRPEGEAGTELWSDMQRQAATIGSLSIDRAYVQSELVDEVIGGGGEILCKPWSGRNTRNPDLFGKVDFKLNMRDRTITCPAGEVEHFEPGMQVHFDPEACGPCPLRAKCTMSASGRGRSVRIAEDEQLQHRLRKLAATRKGRHKLRARTAIEHRLAHIAARKGPKARYRGVRNNLYDLRRAAVIQNLETVQRTVLTAQRAKRAA